MKYNGVSLLDAKINGDALWSTGPNFFARMTALSDTRTAAHFNTASANKTTKYSAEPSGTFVGSLIKEYVVSSPADNLNQVPLVRGLEIVTSSHVRLRQYPGDNSGVTGGVETRSGVSTWVSYTLGPVSNLQAIYMIDWTSQNWMRLRPNARNSGTAGGSYINWFVNTASFASSVSSSFDAETRAAEKLALIQTWLGDIKAASREMVIMITSDLSLTPMS